MLKINVGQKFGWLEVVSLDTGIISGRRHSISRAFVLCRCRCGAVRCVRKSALHRGRATTCGEQKCKVNYRSISVRGVPPLRHKTNAHGYLVVYRDGKTLLEHRIVAEQKLGRPLLPQEVVHHINGIKTDNRPDNLEVTGPGLHRKMYDALVRENAILRRRCAELERMIQDRTSLSKAV